MKKLFILFVILLCCACSKKKEIIEPVEVPKVEEKTYNLSLVMVGDALIHSSVYKDAYNSKTKTYDFKKQLEYIKPIVQEYDLAYYNQETILGGKSIGLSDYPTFNTPQEFGDAMLDAGFNIVSLANNHTMDRGIKAINNSYNYWSKQDNILTSGSYINNEEKNKIKILEKNNISYTMLSYTYGTNGIKVPEGKEYLVNVWPMNSKEKYEAYKEQVKNDIAKVRDMVDILIVAMHWGIEYKLEPNWYQKDCAKFLSSLGVDIIIGTHPHTVQPIEWIDDTLVIYSLGNLISAQENNLDYMKLVGLMSSVDITKTVKNDESTVKLSNLQNELLYTYYKNYRNFKIIPFSQMNASYLKDYKRIYEKYKKVVTKYDNTIQVN